MDEPSDQGKMWAAVSYGSFFFGFPLGVIPLALRDDEFALYHARHATAVWVLHFALIMILTMVLSVISFVTCGLGGLLFPILLVPAAMGAVTSIHGVVLALNGERQEPMGGLGLGEMLFSTITLKDKMPPTPPQLPGPSGDDDAPLS